MSEQDDNWTNSLERTIEVVEGQIALADALNLHGIELSPERALLLIGAIRDLQRRVEALEGEKR